MLIPEKKEFYEYIRTLEAMKNHLRGKDTGSSFDSSSTKYFYEIGIKMYRPSISEIKLSSYESYISIA